MKKRFFLFVVAFVMCIASSCFAADNGTLLSAEEKISTKFINALITDTTAYEEIKSDLTVEMAKNLNSKKFSEVKGQIKSQFGKVSNTKLAILEKHDKVDRLFYIANGTKEKVIEIMLAYDNTGKKPLIDFLTMRALPVQEQAAAKK